MPEKMSPRGLRGWDETHPEDFRQMPLVAEGESKEIRDMGWNHCLIRLKPTVYSFTHNRCGELPGSDVLRLKATKIFLNVLRNAGVRHAYEEVGENYILARIIPSPPPIEVVVKLRHTGTSKHRYYGMAGTKIRSSHPRWAGFPIHAEDPYPDPIVRFDWRNPMYHPETGVRLADEVLCEAQADWFINVEEAKKTALKAHEALWGFLYERGVVLCDICFFITEDGKTMFGEVSQDCGRYRLRGGDSLDKDVWRAGGSSELVLEKWRRLLDIISE